MSSVLRLVPLPPRSLRWSRLSPVASAISPEAGGRPAPAGQAAVYGRPLPRGVHGLRAGQGARRSAHQARGADGQPSRLRSAWAISRTLMRTASCWRGALRRTPSRWRTTPTRCGPLACSRIRSRSSRNRSRLQRDNARALHGLARSLAARNKLNEALSTAQAALDKDPRDAEFHHTVGSIYERMQPVRGSGERLLELHQPAAQQGPQREGRVGARRSALPARVRRAAADQHRRRLERQAAHRAVPRPQRKDHRQGAGQPRTADGLRARHRLGADGHLARDGGAHGHPADRQHPERRRRRSRRARARADAARRARDRLAQGAERAVDHQESAAASACRRARWKASRRWPWGCRSSSTTTGRS